MYIYTCWKYLWRGRLGSMVVSGINYHMIVQRWIETTYHSYIILLSNNSLSGISLGQWRIGVSDIVCDVDTVGLHNSQSFE